ncbi:hypothetical protein [Companilactobacillus mishanensis]|uniref:Uncharacterized protein n=1 Tax=Companilactobacillus mishanensis TaxID=2486008 RepID=A0A5P0ZFM6_9LACO|nr:hypothetical protein [Companilactobacillus mishanensis]MQS51857.1 hypothetical protein [Companilactobacillus mishanensis]
MPSQIKTGVNFFILIILIGLAGTNLLTSSNPLFLDVYTNIFDPFLISLGLFPTILIASVINLEYRVNDVLLIRTHQVIAFQMMLKSFFIIVPLWLSWILTFSFTVIFSEVKTIFIQNFSLIMFASLYVLFVIIFLVAIELNLYLFTNSKLVSFLIAMAINFISFFLYKAKIMTFIFYFSTPELAIDFAQRMLLMIILITFLGFNMVKLSLRKDL